MTTNLTFLVEPYRSVIPEMSLRYPEHWEELALDKSSIPLAPDYAKYNAMADAGMLHVVTARSSGVLVGYFIFVITPGLHYVTTRMALYDIFYLRKPYRKGYNGMRFIQFAETSLREAGVDKMYVGVKLNNDFGKVFERLGFTPAERIYIKLLKEA